MCSARYYVEEMLKFVLDEGDSNSPWFLGGTELLCHSLDRGESHVLVVGCDVSEITHLGFVEKP
jgi:hypothetical protein